MARGTRMSSHQPSPTARKSWAGRRPPATPAPRRGVATRRAAGWWPALCLAVGLAAGCDDTVEIPLAIDVRDSSGVLVIVTPAAYVERLAQWRLAEPPVARFGTEEPDPLFEVSGATTTGRGGTIVVANSSSGELRFFDRQGRFQRSVGGKGGGPGEFRLLVGVWRFRGDSLAAFDWQGGRISVFDSSGNYGRSFTPSPPAGMTHRGLVGFLRDSAPLLWFGDASPLIGGRTGVYADSQLMLRYSPDGTVADTVGRFLGRQWYVWSDGTRAASFPLPFGWSVKAAVHDGTIYVGTGETYEVSRFNEEGTLLGVARIEIENRPVSRSDRRRDRAHRVTLAPYSRDLLDAIPYPSEMPAFTALLVDRLGNVWIRRGLAWGSPGRWMILSPEGRPVARLETPPHGAIFDVADGYLVGVWRDELDVESMRLYGIDRPGSSQ